MQLFGCSCVLAMMKMHSFEDRLKGLSEGVCVWMYVCRIIEVSMLVAALPTGPYTWHAREGVCAFLFTSRWSL